MEPELDADEGQDQGEPGRQVDQPVEQTGDQEEKCPQTEQGEGVGREDDEDLVGDAEDRRDRVEREQDVDAADRQQDQEERREEALAVDPRRQSLPSS